MAGITEAIATAIFCATIGGAEEIRHNYDLGYIRTDCETTHFVIEAGLDKRSSLDSIQQAVFAGTLTNKIPMVVIYDTDGKEGKNEYRIREACRALGIKYTTYTITPWDILDHAETTQNK